MRFPVAQELRQPVGTEFEIDLPATKIAVDDSMVAAPAGTARLLRTDRGLLLRLRAEASLETVCSRCLGEAKAPLPLDMEEEFIPVVDPLTGRHITEEEAEVSYVIGEDLTLDLGEAIRQYALMAAPGKPLCRPDCAGLCPTCGANLNEGACSCPPGEDDRWGALATLKTNDTEGS
jgi:uncharacterized protein